MTAFDLLDEMEHCGIELTDSDGQLNPIWPVLPDGHEDREVVDRAKFLWDRAGWFRDWLDQAHMIREARAGGRD